MSLEVSTKVHGVTSQNTDLRTPDLVECLWSELAAHVDISIALILLIYCHNFMEWL